MNPAIRRGRFIAPIADSSAPGACSAIQMKKFKSINSLPPHPTPTALVDPPTTPPTAAPSLHGTYVEAAQATTAQDQNRHPRQYD